MARGGWAAGPPLEVRKMNYSSELEARIDSEATVRVRTELLPERTHPRAPVGPVLIRIDSRESNQVRAKPPIAPGGGVELLRLARIGSL